MNSNVNNNVSSSIASVILNSSDLDTNASRKKPKKRDRSPSNTTNVATSSADVATTNSQINNNLISSVSSAEPGDLNANVTAASTSTGTAIINQKKEKQRPETWNKIEQQIFFNALRQV